MATKKAAKKTAETKTATRAAAPVKRRVSTAGSGPLTVTQARALVQAESEPAARKSRDAGPRRAAAPRRAGTTEPLTADTTPASVAIERRKLKAKQRAERSQRQRDYKATLELLQARGVKGLPEAALAKRPRRRAPGAEPTAARSGPLRVFAEGDSWFDYPVPFFGGGLVPRLEERLGVPILNLAKAGDESRYMLGVEQRQLIARHLADGCPDGTPWELMLFSGGGNDIVSNPLALWLRDFDATVPAPQLLNMPRYKNALALVAAAYEDLIEMRNRLSPQTHLAFHGYDFAIPDGRGICHLGPWLKPAFDLRGFPGDLVASSQVVQEMLKQFGTMLKALQSYPRVTYVDAQGTLPALRSSWHNEMHPSKGGFNQIADVFHAKIKALFPGRVVE